MKLPEIAHRLRELADQLGEPELRDLAGEIRRRSATRAPNVSAPMTAEIAAQIRALKRSQPGLAQTEIARRYNVNPGRVSEVLHGERT